MTKQLLVIDDEWSILTIIQLCLESFEGWQVTACTPKQALEESRQSSWDAILLEVGADGGQRLLTQLQTQPHTQTTPVVLVTSRVMPLEMRRYQQLDIAGVIAKPFDPKKLGTEISTKVGWLPCLVA